MPNREAAKLLRYVYGLEVRLGDLEQNRPGEDSVREVVVVQDELGMSSSVSTTTKTDFTLQYDDASQGYQRTQYADESGGI